MKSLFKSDLAKQEIFSLYDQKLAELNIEFEYLKVPTSYGHTNIIVTGNLANPPILVIHGSNGCAPIALETYPNLSTQFRVYAIDVLAQPNKSAETRLSMKDDSYGKWINEIIDYLKLENVTMVGFSFGGLVILKTLEFDQSKVKEVFLASPAYLVNGNPFKAMFKIFIPMKRFISTQKPRFVEQFLMEVFSDRDEFAVKFLSQVFLNFDMDFASVPVIDKEKANSITTPITLYAAENDILFPGKKMIERASEIFPSLIKSKLFESGKHVQSRAQNTLIENAIIQSIA